MEIVLCGGVNITDMDENDILVFLKDECGINAKDVTVGWEGDGEGYVVRILIFVNDERTALSISCAIDELEKGEGCPHGVLCKANYVRVYMNNQSLSLSAATMIDCMNIGFMSLILIAVIHTL